MIALFMEIFSRTFFLLKTSVLVYSIIFAPLVLAKAATDTNDIPAQYQKPYYAWGEKTNEIRAGLFWNDEVDDGIKSQDIDVLVLTSITGIEQDYVKPPSEKFAKFELQDSNRVVIVPLRGKELDGKLPQIIQSGDLPQTPKSGHPILIGILLPLDQNRAWPLKEFRIQDAYQIKNEGNYTITVWPTIYHFSSDDQFVTRVDLPRVSMKIHLNPSPEK